MNNSNLQIELSDKKISSIRKEVEQRHQFYPDMLPQIFFNKLSNTRQTQSARAKIKKNNAYEWMKVLAHYLKEMGLAHIVTYVKNNLLPVKEFEYSYDLNELLIINDRDFIDNAFLIILKRHANEQETAYWHQYIDKNNFSKKVMLAKLRFSQEGKQIKTKLSHFFPLWLLSISYTFVYNDTFIK